MTNFRTIKRYRNRKLYDTFQSSYVNLGELAQIIREGVNVKVIDNVTKSDITYQTKMQILFDQERKNPNSNESILTQVIRSNEGNFTGYIGERNEA